MTKDELNAAMPGLPPAQPRRSFFASGEHHGPVPVYDAVNSSRVREGDADFGPERNAKLDLGAPCPDCVHVPGGWQCVCAGSDPMYGNSLVHLTPIDEVALGNVLAAEAQGIFTSTPQATTGVTPDGDNVNLPHHYARFKIEPIRFICENGLNFFQGNIVKYTLRHDAKNGLEDIQKVIRYATMYHEFLAGNPDWWRAKA